MVGRLAAATPAQRPPSPGRSLTRRPALPSSCPDQGNGRRPATFTAPAVSGDSTRPTAGPSPGARPGEEFLPLLYRQFAASPSAHAAFFGLNRDLRSALASGTAKAPRLRGFGRPVRIVFGVVDPYLNAGVARRFHQLFPTSELFLLDGARHYVQLDQPQQVARLLLTIPEG